MANQQNNTALLLFSRGSGQESVAKNFLPFRSPAKNKKIAQKIIDRSIYLAGQSDLPFFIWDEKLQHGNNFGEKLAGAVDAVFQKGYEKIIVIGNDCLTLNTHHIKEAVVAIQTNESVIAPTKKGGVYLIGISQKSFNKKAFTAIRWQSSFAYHDLQNLFSFPAFQLSLLDDVNNFNDLRTQVSQLIKTDALRMYVVSIVASIKKYLPAFKNRISIFIFRFSFGLKAPPVSSFSF